MSTTTHHHSGSSRRRNRRPLAILTAAAAGAALVAGATLSLLSGGAAFAATKPAWAMTAGNIKNLSQLDPATTAHFFNTASAHGNGSSLVASPVQSGYATTPVLSYSSYAQFSSDVKSGAIRFPYKWVMYDPEEWGKTPVGEQRDPVKYLKLFGQLAHAHGLKAMEAPALDLAYVSGSLYPRQSLESAEHWWTRVNMSAAAATNGDIYVLQDESNVPDLSQYDSLYTAAAAQARAANPGIAVYAEVSTSNGTSAQMTAAARSVSPDGYYVAAPNNMSRVHTFFKNMKAAGY